MGVLWFAGVSLYSAGAMLSGSLGPVLAWPLFTCSTILAAGLHGLSGGEWRHVTDSILGQYIAGLVLLMASIVVICNA